MRKFIRDKFEKKPPRERRFKAPPKPDVPQRAPILLQPAHTQEQSPLFSKLSAEVRILIYELVLGDPIVPMHILEYDNQSGYVGRCRCIDKDSPFPVWQHKCFGRWLEEGNQLLHCLTPNCKDTLLALPMTCRRIYSESLGLLYKKNEFSFKGASGVLALRATVPQLHWHTIRHMHVSTVFLTPWHYWVNKKSYPPENFALWRESCVALHELRSLRSLRLDIMIWHFVNRKRPEHPSVIDDESILAVLQPLKDIEAEEFEIEMNFEVPSSVLKALGQVNFNITVKERPSNKAVFAF